MWGGHVSSVPCLCLGTAARPHSLDKLLQSTTQTRQVCGCGASEGVETSGCWGEPGGRPTNNLLMISKSTPNTTSTGIIAPPPSRQSCPAAPRVSAARLRRSHFLILPLPFHPPLFTAHHHLHVERRAAWGLRSLQVVPQQYVRIPTSVLPSLLFLVTFFTDQIHSSLSPPFLCPSPLFQAKGGDDDLDALLTQFKVRACPPRLVLSFPPSCTPSCPSVDD